MYIKGSYGIIKNPDIIFVDEADTKGYIDVIAENEDYKVELYKDIPKSALNQIMSDIHLQMVLQNEN